MNERKLPIGIQTPAQKPVAGHDTGRLTAVRPRRATAPAPGGERFRRAGSAVSGVLFLHPLRVAHEKQHPMNELFEAFIGRSLKRALAPRTVHLQHRRRSALIGANCEPIFALQPDVVIEDFGDRHIILDTKWKRLTPRARGCKTTLGVAQSDIYQMLAYTRAYDANTPRSHLSLARRAGPGAGGDSPMDGDRNRLSSGRRDSRRPTPRRSRGDPAWNMRIRAGVRPSGPFQPARSPEGH